MILDCNFEELQALAAGADLFLAGCAGADMTGSIAAPAEAIEQVTLLQSRLSGDMELTTLAEQRTMRNAVAAICRELHERMDEKVLEYHPAHEEAVALYFDYAHASGVLARLDEIGAQMEAVIELMTGAAPTEEEARIVDFSDE